MTKKGFMHLGHYIPDTSNDERDATTNRCNQIIWKSRLPKEDSIQTVS